MLVLMLLVIGLFYLAREHYAHATQLLPYLILLLCPLLHLFGHRHGAHAPQHRAAASAKHQPRE
ncbi:DUF2933 domain-containing protein [Pseudomonas sp. MBLB4123]|uniref:DUF2933 domain-containing protein n=1 Tax=Pseudomonas sp. MBLB4123 TaxID=3451557 RepID=UPI003F754A78